MPLSGSALAHLLRLQRSAREFGLAAGWKLDAAAVLTDNALLSKMLGKPMLFQTRFGVRYDDIGHDPMAGLAENHRDYFLATFAEMGLPLSTPLRMAGGEFTIADLLRDSEANFDPSQVEIPWTVVGYRIYLANDRAWTNRDGERFTFDDLAKALLTHPRGAGSCGGTHLLFAMELLLREGQSPSPTVLSADIRDRVAERVKADVAAAVNSQSPDGYWCLDWFRGTPPTPSRFNNDFWRFVVTGHMLEFFEYLPPEMQPSDDVYRKGAGWLYRELAKGHHVTAATLCPWTHSVCAISQLVDPPAGPSPTASSAYGGP